MLKQHVRNLLKEGEGLSIEYKECRNSLNKDIYETVCAFLNELGSGVRNLYKYTQILSGRKPQFTEEGIFKVFVPLTKNETLNETLNETEKAILTAIRTNPNTTWKEMEALTGKSRATVARHIAALKESGYLERQGSDKKGNWKLLKEISHE